MRRHSGQKPLYEAMSRSRSKPKRLSMLARLRPQLEKLRPHLEKLRKVGAARVERSVAGPEPAAGKPAPVVLKPPRPVDVSEANTQGPAQTWLRPKAVQFNDGRIEVSLPYQIGIIIGLGFVLLVMIGFWFGHRLGRIDERSRYAKASQSPRASVDDVPTPSGTSDAGVPASDSPAPAQRPAVDTGRVARAPGDNVIVLGRHAVKTQLEPVRDYFRDHGVDTRILSYERLRTHFAQNELDASRLPKGDGFMLVTYKLYDNPDREGTNGNAAKQKIVELGRGYRAPRGYESFAANYFSDAYGMKIVK